MLAGETVVVEGFVGVGAVGSAPVDLKDGLVGMSYWMGHCALVRYLGGNDEVVLLPAEFLDCLSEDNLRLSAGVYFGGIEEVDAGIVGYFHTFKGGFCCLLDSINCINGGRHTIPDVSAVCEPATQRDN